ncbi:MAG: 2'-5' RNA ligase family protein [Prevotella sp.]|nr:2'-5' RNA ligase family protein [Prevotella sp.]
MKTYLEIKVPIKYDDPWFEELRSHFAGIPVRWQKDFYHITMVFINDAPKGIDMRSLLERHLATAQAPVITFDQLDAFSTRPGMHIIHLSASEVPKTFHTLTEAIRTDMKAVGCVIHSDFMLHVTLGRVKSFDVKLSDLKKVMETVSPPSFTLTLTDGDYREFRGRTLYETSLKRP